jgi:preprotein translocase SecE subunit
MSFIDYLKDTRAELRHVAWPTQTQTIVFTVLVVVISVFTSLYLGFFDYLFTGTLQRVVVGGSAITEPITPPATTSPITVTPVSTSSAPLNSFIPKSN